MLHSAQNTSNTFNLFPVLLSQALPFDLSKAKSDQRERLLTRRMEVPILCVRKKQSLKRHKIQNILAQIVLSF